MDDGLFGVAHLGADGSAQAEAHGAEAAGGEQLTGIVKLKVLDGPHLMLAHVGGDDGIVGTHPGDGVQDLLGGQVVGVLVVSRLGGEGEDVLFPLAVVILGDLAVEQLQHLLGVADDVVVSLHILVDLSPVDVDLDDLGLAGEGRGLQGHTVREAAAHGDEQVAAVAGHVGGLGAVHADHAGGERVAAGDAAGTHQGDRHGGVDLPGKLAELLVGAAAGHAAAADEHGLLGLGDHVHQLVHVLLVGFGHLQAAGPGAADEVGQAAGGGVLLAGQVLILCLLGGDVLHDVDQNRAGAAAAGQGKGLADDVGQGVHVPHQIGALGDGHGNAGDVHLLEGVAADQVLGHVAGDEDHGGRVHIGRADAGGQVGRARAGGGQAHAHLAGGAGVTVCCVGSALLVGGQDVGDPISVLIQLIVDVQDGAAGIAEHEVDSLLQKAFHQDLGTSHFHAVSSSFLGVSFLRDNKKSSGGLSRAKR